VRVALALPPVDILQRYDIILRGARCIIYVLCLLAYYSAQRTDDENTTCVVLYKPRRRGGKGGKY